MTADQIIKTEPLANEITTTDADWRLAAIVEHSEDAILSLTPDGKVLTFNRGAQMMFGCAESEIIGRSVFQLVPLGHGGELQENLKRIRNGESLNHFETVRMRKDGQLFDASLRISPIKDPCGNVIGISWIARDVSERKKGELLIQTLSSVVEQTADSVMITDKNGKLEYVNSAFLSSSGFSREEVIGRSPNIVKSGHHPPEFYQNLWQTILGGQPFRATMINKKKNGELFYTEKTITPLKDKGGQILHFVSTDKDITEQKLAEEQFRQMQRRFSGLFNYSSDAMAYCSLDGTFIEANRAFSKLTGYSREELLHKMQYQNISYREHWAQGNKMLVNIIETGEPCTYEKEYIRKDGETVPTLVTAFPVKDGEDGKVTGIGAIVKDITELKKQRIQLELAARELKHSNDDLEQFASVASHDLQEPLRTISSYLNLLSKKSASTLDADSKEYLAFASDGAERLRALIQDLLTYSRVGTKPKVFSEIDTDDVFRKALFNLRDAIKETNAQVTAAKLPNIQGDPIGMVELFQNLIGNAIKYHSDHAPIVRVSAKRTDSAWLFKIKDNGIGIDSAARTRIFGMFQRLHGRSEFPGTGIGLAICKKIVEQRGGKIWVDSRIRKGSTFSFTVPDKSPLI